MRTLLTILLLSTLTGYSQEIEKYGTDDILQTQKEPKGNYKTENTKQDYEIWVKLDKGYMKVYKTTSIGIKHAIEDAHSLLSANDRSLYSADVDKTYLASYIDNLTDYGSLSTSLRTESSEIKKIWNIGEWYIGLISLKSQISLMVIKTESR